LFIFRSIWRIKCGTQSSQTLGCNVNYDFDEKVTFFAEIKNARVAFSWICFVEITKDKYLGYGI
jgi:hypothetical protein